MILRRRRPMIMNSFFYSCVLYNWHFTRIHGDYFIPASNGIGDTTLRLTKNLSYEGFHIQYIIFGHEGFHIHYMIPGRARWTISVQPLQSSHSNPITVIQSLQSNHFNPITEFQCTDPQIQPARSSSCWPLPALSILPASPLLAPANTCQLLLAPASSGHIQSCQLLPILVSPCQPLPAPASPCPPLPAPSRFCQPLPTPARPCQPLTFASYRTFQLCQINSSIHICAAGSAAEASALKFIQRQVLRDTARDWHKCDYCIPLG